MIGSGMWSLKRHFTCPFLTNDMVFSHFTCVFLTNDMVFRLPITIFGTMFMQISLHNGHLPDAMAEASTSALTYNAIVKYHLHRILDPFECVETLYLCCVQSALLILQIGFKHIVVIMTN